MDIQIKKKRGLKTKHYAYLAIGSVVLAAGWFFFQSSVTPTFRVQKEKVTIAAVLDGEFDDYITISGSVAPITTVYMDAYEGGRVSEKLIEEGTMVEKGDVILRLENNNLYEQILASESNLALKQNDLRSTKLNFESRIFNGRKSLANDQNDLTRSKRNFEQNKELYKEGLISKEEFLLSKENYELAQKQFNISKLQTEQDEAYSKSSLSDLDADLGRMQKTLSMVYERLDHLNVRAPASGQLGFLDAEVGQNISQGQRIGQINILTDFKIEANIDEHYIDRIKRELEASLTRQNKEFNLRVRKVYPEVRNNRFQIDLVFKDEKPETIRTGQSYNLKLKLGESNSALLIPKGSFFQSTGGQWAFVLDPDGKEARKRSITIGKQNSKYYEVLNGLEPGEQVITSGYESFGDVERIVLR